MSRNNRYKVTCEKSDIIYTYTQPKELISSWAQHNDILVRKSI